MHRLIEGYENVNDSVYNAWKLLHEDWERINNQIESENHNAENILSDDIEPIVSSVLKYPSIQRNAKKTGSKIEIPKHMTGEDALKILHIQEEQKQREELIKEVKRRKKEKKKSMPPAKKQKKTENEQTNNKKTIRKHVQKKIVFEDSINLSDTEMIVEEELTSEIESSSSNDEEDACGECHESNGNTNDLWIQCDHCETWYHSVCTVMRKRTKRQIDNLKTFKCHKC